MNWPSDPGRWLTPPDLAAAWVALVAGDLAGHAVVLDSGEVGRLFVTPAARRRSVASALLAAAADWAAAEGRELTLNVTDTRRSAAVAPLRGRRLAAHAHHNRRLDRPGRLTRTAAALPPPSPRVVEPRAVVQLAGRLRERGDAQFVASHGLVHTVGARCALRSTWISGSVAVEQGDRANCPR